MTRAQNNRALLFFLIALSIGVAPGTALAQLGGPWWSDTRSYCPKVFTGRDKVRLCAIALFTDWPVHLVVAGAGPMSGFGAGIGTDHDFNTTRLRMNVKGDLILTTKRFWATDDTLTFFSPPLGNGVKNRGRLQLFSGYHVKPTLNYFGLGAFTRDEPVEFGIREWTAGIAATWPLNGWLTIGAGAEYRDPLLDAASAAAFLSQQFTEDNSPGITRQPDFLRYHVTLSWYHPSEPPFQQSGWIRFSVYRALGDGAYSFDRIEGRQAGAIQLGSGELDVVGRFALSEAFGGDAIPFYYEPTLGGQDVEGFETLRGFTDLRFRGPHMILAQVDYTHPMLVDMVHGRIFVDVGQVSQSTSKFALDQLRHDVGVGLDLVLGGRSRAQTYWAYAAGEHGRFGFTVSQGY